MLGGGGALGNISGTISISLGSSLSQLGQLKSSLNGLNGAGSGVGSGLEKSLGGVKASATSATSSVHGLTGAMSEADSAGSGVGSGFSAGASQVASSAESAAKRIKDAAKGIKDVGTNLSKWVTAPILGAGALAVNQASDLNEAVSATNTVYGDSAQGVIDKSKQASQAVGLSQEQYLTATTQLAAFGTQMGLNSDETANFSEQMVTNAADLASFYNTSPTDALEAQTAAMRGEFDPLERYGIIMNAATVQQYALSKGIWDGNGTMTNQQLQLARSGYLMSQLTDDTGSAHAAQGDFIRTSAGLANQQRILSAELKDTAASIGTVLLPFVLKGVAALERFLHTIQSLSDTQRKWVVGLAAVAAAIGPILLGIGTVLPGLVRGFQAVTTVLKTLGIVSRASAISTAAMGPAGVEAGAGMEAGAVGARSFGKSLITALGPIALLVAAGFALYEAYKHNFLGFGDLVNGVIDRVQAALTRFGKVYEVLTQAFHTNPFSAFMTALGDMIPILQPITGFFARIGMGVQGFITTFKKAFDELTAPVSAGMHQINQIGGVVDNYGKTISRAAGFFHALATAIRSIGGDNTPKFLVSLAAGLDHIGNTIQGVIGFFQRWQQAWENLVHPVNTGMAQLDRWGGIVSRSTSSVNKFVAILGTLGYAISGIGGGKIAFFRNLGNDLVTAAFQVTKLITTFKNLRLIGLNPVEAALRAVGITFPKLSGVTSYLEDKIGKVSDAFGFFRSAGIDPVHAALDAMQLVFPGLSGAIEAVRGVVDTVVSVFKDLKTAVSDALGGDWKGALSAIKTAFSDAFGGLKDLGGAVLAGLVALFQAIDWGAVGSTIWSGILTALGAVGNIAGSIVSKLGDLAGAIWGWVTSAVGAVNWDVLWADVKDEAGTIVGKLGDLVSAISGWVTDAVSAVNWDVLWADVKDVTSVILGKLGDLASAVQTWVTNAVSTIPWVTIWDAVTDATSTILGKLGNLASAVQAWVTNAVSTIPWATLWDAVTDATGAIVGKLGDLASAIATWVSGAVSGVDWSSLWDGVIDVTATITGKLGSLSLAIFDWAKNAVASVNWTGIWGTVTDVTATIVGKLGSLGLAVYDWASTAIGTVNWNGLWGSVKDVTLTVVGKLGDLASAVFTWASNAISTINWTGLWGSVVDVTSTIVSKFGSLSLAIFDWAVAAISSVDWQGLWGGVVDVTSTIVDRFGSLSLAIFNWVVAAVTSVDWTGVWGTIEDATASIVSKLGDLSSAISTWVTTSTAGVDWSSLFTAALQGKSIDLSDALDVKITGFGEKVGQAISDAFSDPKTAAKVAVGAAVLAGAIFTFPEGVFALAIALALQTFGPALNQALTDFFKGVFKGIGLDHLFDTITQQLNRAFAGFLKTLYDVVNSLPPFPGKDKLLGELDGWKNDFQTKGGEIADSVFEGMKKIFTDTHGNDYNPSNFGFGYDPSTEVHQVTDANRAKAQQSQEQFGKYGQQNLLYDSPSSGPSARPHFTQDQPDAGYQPDVGQVQSLLSKQKFMLPPLDTSVFRQSITGAVSTGIGAVTSGLKNVAAKRLPGPDASPFQSTIGSAVQIGVAAVTSGFAQVGAKRIPPPSTVDVGTALQGILTKLTSTATAFTTTSLGSLKAPNTTAVKTALDSLVTKAQQVARDMAAALSGSISGPTIKSGAAPAPATPQGPAVPTGVKTAIPAPDTGPALTALAAIQAGVASATAAVQAAISQAQTVVAQKFTGMLTAGQPPVQQLSTGTQTNFTTMGGLVNSATSLMAGQVGTQFGTMSVVNQGVAAALNTGVSGQFLGMSGQTTGTTGIMAGTVGGQFAGMQGNAIGAAGGMSGGVSGAVGAMSGAVTGTTGGMQGTVSGHMYGMQGQGIGAAQGMQGGVVGALQSMSGGGIGAAYDMTNGVVGAIANSGAPGSAYTLGINIGSSLASGLAAMAGAVGAQAAALVAQVDSAIRAKAAIASPSKLFIKRGEQMGIGPAIGIANMIPKVRAAATSLVAAVTDAVSRPIAMTWDLTEAKRLQSQIESGWNSNVAQSLIQPLEDRVLALGKYLHMSVAEDFSLVPTSFYGTSSGADTSITATLKQATRAIQAVGKGVQVIAVNTQHLPRPGQGGTPGTSDGTGTATGTADQAQLDALKKWQTWQSALLAEAKRLGGALTGSYSLQQIMNRRLGDPIDRMIERLGQIAYATGTTLNDRFQLIGGVLQDAIGGSAGQIGTAINQTVQQAAQTVVTATRQAAQQQAASGVHVARPTTSAPVGLVNGVVGTRPVAATTVVQHITQQAPTTVHVDLNANTSEAMARTEKFFAGLQNGVVVVNGTNARPARNGGR